MSEVESAVNTFLVQYICDTCATSVVEFYAEYPANAATPYRHICSDVECAVTVDLAKKYPYANYVFVG